VSFEDEVRTELRALEEAQLLRVPRVLEGRQGTKVVIDGVEVTSFASNDYLGLAGDPRLARAAASSLEEHGVGVGASRLIVGNHRAHVALEQAVADWLRCEGVTLFNTGFAANVGVLTSILRAGDVVFSDELNHASIIDGCRLARAEVCVVPHRDLEALERGLRERAGRRRVVVSESVFSMDGDVADVRGLDELCRRHEAVFVLDEAHALGVLGPEGRGVAAANGVVPDIVIGTFGKALGTFGAFAASSRSVAQLFWNRARSLVFSTGFPPSIAAASRAAIEIVRGSDGQAKRAYVAALGARLRAKPLDVGGDSAIAPVVIGDAQRTLAIAKQLLEAKLFVAAVRPPTVPRGTSRLRISVSAGHEGSEVDDLRSMLQRVKGVT
jgi:8-amino-7-oxononanoate synthase